MLVIVCIGRFILQQILNQQVEILTFLLHQTEYLESCCNIAQAEEGVVHHLPIHHGQENIGIVNLGYINIEKILVDNDEVGLLADLNGADSSSNPMV